MKGELPSEMLSGPDAVEPLRFSYHGNAHYNSVQRLGCTYPLGLRATSVIRSHRVAARAEAASLSEQAVRVQGACLARRVAMLLCPAVQKKCRPAKCWRSTHVSPPRKCLLSCKMCCGSRPVCRCVSLCTCRCQCRCFWAGLTGPPTRACRRVPVVKQGTPKEHATAAVWTCVAVSAPIASRVRDWLPWRLGVLCGRPRTAPSWAVCGSRRSAS